MKNLVSYIKESNKEDVIISAVKYKKLDENTFIKQTTKLFDEVAKKIGDGKFIDCELGRGRSLRRWLEYRKNKDYIKVIYEEWKHFVKDYGDKGWYMVVTDGYYGRRGILLNSDPDIQRDIDGGEKDFAKWMSDEYDKGRMFAD